MKVEELKQGLSSFWETVGQGWQHLRQSASNALTRFKPGEQTNLPAKTDIDDMFYIPSGTWSMLGGNLFEDDNRVVVHIEVPGLDKENLDIDVHGTTLTVRGEKQFERESTQGRYRVLQCAYGAFQRSIALPAEVVADQARAAYKNGVLRIELPKALAGAPRRHTVKVD
jgi:HSP20 family protein